jgi:integrase
MIKLPHGCKRYQDRLGQVRIYYRHTRPPTVLPGLPYSKEFMEVYDAAKANAGRERVVVVIGAGRTQPGSLNAGLVKYYGSPAFTNDLAKSTQRHARALLDRWRKELIKGRCRGDRPLRDLQHKHLQAFISSLAKPSVQRNMLRAITGFLKFALGAGLTDNNAAAGVTRAKMIDTGGFKPWTEQDVDKYAARHSIGSSAYLALQIMLCLGVRLSDAIQIGPRHIRKTTEHPNGELTDYQPQKGRRTGGRHITVPLHDDLVAAIKAAPVTGTETFLVSGWGRPFSAKGFSEKMREWCDAAGLTEVSSHGLRKLCLIRLAEAGCTVFEIAAISGHKELAEIQLYVDAYNRKQAGRRAHEKRLAGSKSEQNGKTVG